MKVSWHGNRKHISAHWHTKGLPVLHVAFLREGIQRGFKCYHDLTNKISQLWLTRVLNFHFFMRPCISCFSLFLHRPIMWSIESTFFVTHLWVYFLHTYYVMFECCWSTWELKISKTHTKLIPSLFYTFFQPLAVPVSVITFHLIVDAGEVLIGEQWESIYLFFLFDLR